MVSSSEIQPAPQLQRIPRKGTEKLSRKYYRLLLTSIGQGITSTSLGDENKVGSNQELSYLRITPYAS